MPQFLELIPLADALNSFLSELPGPNPKVEKIKTVNALGRILHGDVIAQEPLPAFSRSTVDGYAVIASDTYGASESLPVYLTVLGEVSMGDSPSFSLSAGKTGIIHTGGMLPNGTNAVVMIEDTQITREQEVEVYKPVSVGENVIQAGEDVQIGDRVLDKGTRLRSSEIGGLLALGITEINVSKPPRVAILSSGDEIIPPDQIPGPGQVRDINSFTLSTLIQKYGGEPVLFGVVKDNLQDFISITQEAFDETDMVVITAGSSASARDLTSKVIAKLGKPGVLVHGVRIRPGKPTILAVCDGKPVIGLPGNPVSALVIANYFVVPAIQHLLEKKKPKFNPVIRAKLSLNLPSVAGREDFVPARLSQHGDEILAEPIFFKSNMIFTLAQADGLIHVPADAVGLTLGEFVNVILQG